MSSSATFDMLCSLTDNFGGIFAFCNQLISKQKVQDSFAILVSVCDKANPAKIIFEFESNIFHHFRIDIPAICLHIVDCSYMLNFFFEKFGKLHGFFSMHFFQICSQIGIFFNQFLYRLNHIWTCGKKGAYLCHCINH